MKNSGNHRKMGAIPIISEALARHRVARLERRLAKFRVRTSQALAKLSVECARRAELEAAVLAAREAVRELSPEVQTRYLERIRKAEERLEAMRPACEIGRTQEPAQEPPGLADIRRETTPGGGA